jgi:hypothetical protein
MKIISRKIPIHMKELPLLFEFLESPDGDSLLSDIVQALSKMDHKPNNANVSFKTIAYELEAIGDDLLWFEFYWSKNLLFGHNVISYADRGHTIYYNKRFHSCSTFGIENWIENFFHELTHLADQKSIYSFGHKNQDDKLAAPFVIGALARKIYEEKYK